LLSTTAMTGPTLPAWGDWE